MPHPLVPPTPHDSTDLVASEYGKYLPAININLPSPALQPTPQALRRYHSAELYPSNAEPVLQSKGPQSRAKGGFSEEKSKSLKGGGPSTRRCARKTAHSVIERRRRCKMNEQFATLKNMIPGCEDQEMHKSAILEASIGHLSEVKASLARLESQYNSPLNRSSGERSPIRDPGTPIASPILPSPSTFEHQQFTTQRCTLPSPILDMRPENGSESRDHDEFASGERVSVSTASSPLSSKEQDQEASAVLLALHHDRRHDSIDSKSQGAPHTAGKDVKHNGRRGMSVGDLLAH